jgi:hypothetical protein
VANAGLLKQAISHSNVIHGFGEVKTGKETSHS